MTPLSYYSINCDMEWNDANEEESWLRVTEVDVLLRLCQTT